MEYKTGKTTTATKFPKNLLLASEKGYNALAGVMAQPINKWTDLLKVTKQLQKDQAKEMYETVILDTVDNLYDMCEQFILDREDVSKVGDIPYGQGYGMIEKEFDRALREIPLLGYGLVMISHSEDKTFKDESGEEYQKIVPTVPKKPRKIVLRMADIIGYSRSVEGEEGTKTMLYMRGTPRFEAGSRFKYTPDKIELSYDNLVNAIGDAIEKEQKEDGIETVDEHINNYEDKTARTYDEVMAEIKQVGDILAKAGMITKINKISEQYLGKGKKVSEATENQVDILVLILDDMLEASQELED